MYLQHALLLLLPPFLTLSLLIRVPRPAVTLPGLRQHRGWHLPDPTTHPHTQNCVDGHIHNKTKKKPQPAFTDSHTQSSGIKKPPLPTRGRTHTRKDISTTYTTGKEGEKGKTEIVGLPQEHYSNASQRLPTKERERQRNKQMRSKEKWKQFRPFMYSILIWHATPAALHRLQCEAASSQEHKQLNAIVIFSDADESLRCRGRFPISF